MNAGSRAPGMPPATISLPAQGISMTTPQDVQQFTGRTAVGSDGSKIGQVYLDEQTGQPLWVTVTTGMFGTRQSFAPVYGSRLDRGTAGTAPRRAGALPRGKVRRFPAACV